MTRTTIGEPLTVGHTIGSLKAQAVWWDILAGRTSNPDDRVRSAANAAHLRHAVELITATRQESKP